jgi:hypothetical protein
VNAAGRARIREIFTYQLGGHGSIAELAVAVARDGLYGEDAHPDPARVRRDCREALREPVERLGVMVPFAEPIR